MSTVRAKFRCNEIVKSEYNETVKMSPVYSDDEGSENKKFTDATPFGSFEIGIDNDAPAHGYFGVGKEYYFDIKEAPKEDG